MAKHTHSDRLERWLGKDHVERVSREFKDFYWPVAVHGVPGNVYVMPGGDFTGEIKAGQYFTKEDGAASVMRKILKRAEAKAHKEKALGVLADMIKSENSAALSVGAFASIDAVIAAATSGKGQMIPYYKSSGTSIPSGQVRDTWLIPTGSPAAGGNGAAAPGGTVPTASSAGALNFKNLGAANTGHYLSWVSSVTTPNTANTLVLYDRLFMVAKTMNSTATEAVTGVPTRYQSSVTTDKNYIGGNFCFPLVVTTLPVTAHNWTVCQYTDQDGNTAQSFQSAAGVASAAPSSLDLLANYWFLPLAAGDVGVKALTQMQCSAALASGAIDFVIGHPIAVNVCPTANVTALDDGLLTALNLHPILDNACLSFLQLASTASSSIAMNGYIRTVSE